MKPGDVRALTLTLNDIIMLSFDITNSMGILKSSFKVFLLHIVQCYFISR